MSWTDIHRAIDFYISMGDFAEAKQWTQKGLQQAYSSFIDPTFVVKELRQRKKQILELERIAEHQTQSNPT